MTSLGFPRSFLLFATLISCCSVACAQCPPPAWIATNQIPGVNGSVYASTSWDPDGNGPQPPVLVVGGSFSVAGSAVVTNVATWDGLSWQALGTGFNNAVEALTVFNGDVIAGGLFTGSFGAPASYVARWNGTAWQPVGAGGPGGLVFSLAVHNGQLVAGGNFATSGVQVWNGAAWAPLGTGVPAPLSLTVLNTDLVAATANGVHRWNGSTWQNMTPGTTNGSAQAVGLYNGQLVAGGAFTQIDGVAANRIASWNGTSWAPLGAGMGNGEVRALHVFNGELVAGGIFGTAGGTTALSIARWNGSSWSTLGPGLGTGIGLETAYVGTLTTWNSGLVAGGAFHSVGGMSARNVASWDGSTWSSLGAGLDSAIYAFAIDGGDLLLAGDFRGPVGNATTRQVLRWNGSSYQALGLGIKGQINALAVYNGDVIAAGNFTMAGGVPASRIARWNGTAWTALGGGLTGGTPNYGNFAGDGKALAVYNGELIAAGNFTIAGGVPASMIARWNGSIWQPLLAGLNATVFSLAVYNGELYAGGSFLNAGGVPAANIARWDGNSWQSVGGIVSGVGSTLLTTYGGELIAYGPSIPSQMARWNGSLWQPMPPPPGPATVLGTWGPYLVAGGLNFVSRWDGTAWSVLGNGLALPEALIDYHGALMVGGSIITLGGVTSPWFIRYASPLPALALSQPAGPGTGVQVSNHWLIPGHEYFNIASPNPCFAGPGTGPYGGLCFANVGDLAAQVMLPVGATPFHFIAGGSTATFGPFPLPPGFSLEVLAADVTGGVLGCLSSVTPFTVN